MRKSLCVWIAISLSVWCGVSSYAQHRMTLEQMYALADSLNATIKASDYSVQEAEGGVDVARNALLPSIQASASVSLNGFGYSMDRNFTNAVDEQLPLWGNNIELQVSQVVFAGGAIRNGIEAAELGAQLASVQARSNRQEVRYLIAGTSLEIAKIENQIKVIDANIELAGKLLEQVRNLHAEGVVLRNDITRIELLSQELAHTRVSLVSARDIMCSKLAMTLGLDVTESVEPVLDLDSSTPDEGAARWLDAAESSSSAIQGAQLATQLKNAELQIAKAERLPSIALFAGDTFNGPDVTTFIAGKMAGYGLLDKNFNFATVGVGITYNLDSIYKSGKKIRRSEAALRKSQEDLRGARQGISLAVNAAYIEYHNSFTQLDIKTKALELASDSYEMIESRYGSGLATMTDLLEASSQKLQAELAQVNARMDVLANHYKLLYVSGTI